MFKGITLVSWSRQDKRTSFLKISAVWGGVLWAFACNAFTCAALTIWVLMTAGQVYHFSGIIWAGILLGAVLGGAVSGKMAGSLGWLHGTVAGLVYYLTVAAFFAVWNSGSTALAELGARCVAVMILAAVGGIIGVNLPAFNRTKKYGTRLG